MQPNNSVSNLSDTIVPKSDQLNAEMLLTGSITITVTGVSRGNAEQPVIINYDGDNGRPYKPCKTMRKLLIFAWGDDGHKWVGKSMTLYNNPEVKFGGVKVGGIRISHLSDIPRDISISLTATKGKKEPITVKKLVGVSAANQNTPQQEAPPVDVSQYISALQEAAASGMESLAEVWKSIPSAAKAAIGPNGCPAEYKALAQAADDSKPKESEA